jgi:Glycosyl transferase family 2/Methyltransferase domain
MASPGRCVGPSDGAVTACSRCRPRLGGMGRGCTNGEARLPTTRHDGSPEAGNVFACLVHEAPDCVADLVANLQHLDPDSTVLLYDGSGGALLSELSRLTGPGVLVHPHPRAMAWGKLQDFALDSMRFALERLDMRALTIVDSDQLAMRPGYSVYLADFLAKHPRAGCLVSAEGVQPRTTRVGPPQAAWREFELWAPFLRRFPDGESRFPHWTFWPATVFTRAAAQSLVALWEDDELQGILAKSAIWASEEVVLPTLVALLGHQVVRNPCAHDLVQYRTTYTAAQVEAAMRRPAVFWVHPVPRSYRDPLRSRLRTHFGGYLPQPAAVVADPFTAPPAHPLPLLLPLLRRMETIVGWLSAAEADLLSAAAMRATTGRRGPHTIVEVGSYCGRGTVVLAGVAGALSPGSVVHAIDPHDRRLGVWGDGPGGVTDAATRLQSHLDAAGLRNVVDYRPGYAGEVAVPGPIDLLVVDHLHDYASVAADFSQFEAQIVEGGLVAFHDYRDCFPGVVAFVDHLLATEAYTAVQRVETLVVLRKAGVLALPPLSPMLAGVGSAGERDALAVLALTAAETLRGGEGGIVEAGRPTAAEEQLLTAAAEAAGGALTGGQPPELPVRLLMLGGHSAGGEDVDAAFRYRERLADGARVVLRGCSDDSPVAHAALRALLAGGFEQVRRMAGLVVLRAGVESRPLSAAADSQLAVGEPVPTRTGVAQAPNWISGQPTGWRPTGEPLVSCIMPTCDRRRFVGRAIRYFRDQDYPNRELVIIDDGADCVADLIPADPRIRYVRLPERRTIGAKRNLACEHAHGELVVHWDDDDWSAPWRLGYQVEMFQNQDVDVSGLSALYFCDPAAGRAWRYEYPAGRRAWVTDGTFCYRRRFWEEAPFPDTSFGIDTSYLWQGASKRVGALADSSFYVAQVHPGNTSRKEIHGAWWHPRPVEEIASLMGPEWAAHWAAESVS